MVHILATVYLNSNVQLINILIHVLLSYVKFISELCYSVMSVNNYSYCERTGKGVRISSTHALPRRMP
jgi:hypothetical protein